MQDDEGPLFELRPDAVIDTPSGPIVLDTKWKKLASNGDRKLGVVQGDVYQMLAYAQAYEAERLVLLYPWLEGVKRGAVRRWRVVGTERKLEIAAVDVGEPRSVVCALRKIVGMG